MTEQGIFRDLPLLGATLLCLALVVFVPPADGHPAHAKPVNYPFVVGFERFHSGLDDDDYLAEGGFILLDELNCVSCHEPPKALREQLTGTIATDLTGAATRLSHVNLEIMIRNPRFVKRDTTMPSLFAGPDRDMEEVEALKHYLATLTYDVPDYPTGDIERGRSFYHTVGCVACHAPEVGYRPPGIPENPEIELTGLPSVPMNLADLYTIDALAHFLLNPREHRPSGQMPDFKLSQEEALDLAAYLKAGPDLILPKNLTEALNDPNSFEIDPALVELGREVFRSKNCSACHTEPGGNGKRTTGRAIPLADLPPDSRSGCLSERPTSGGIPFYGLDEVQKRAITAALQRLEGRAKFDRAAQIDWRMKTLNCYACHERGGVGGPEIARESYFGFADEKAIALGRWGHLPPALDHVGAKLTNDWMERILTGLRGGGEVRPYMTARMPLYLDRDTEWFANNFSKVDEVKGEKAALNGNADSGEPLVGAEGKNCQQCHPIGPTPSSDLPGINLATSPERLQQNYFRQLLLDPQTLQPGTMMPDQFESDPENLRQISGLWKYLKSLPAE